MVLGFSFSVIIGVAFGFLPARKAARLNPRAASRLSSSFFKTWGRAGDWAGMGEDAFLI